MTLPTPLTNLSKDKDDIFGAVVVNEAQALELRLREEVAAVVYDDYLLTISKHHSIEVMDKEVNDFISKIPTNGVICDIGGCWGWHWRNIHFLRPDIQIVIVDFAKSNLLHAKKLLQERINKNIWLVHGDATALNFPNESFDGYWTVQTLQHIPDFEKAIAEARRVLKQNGAFSNYSLNNASLIRPIYKIFRKEYVTNGMVGGSFFLRRADRNQLSLIKSIFCNDVSERYSEILFKPEFKLNFMGKENSWLGKLDALLTGNIPFTSLIARQRSFHTTKAQSANTDTSGGGLL